MNQDGFKFDVNKCRNYVNSVDDYDIRYDDGTRRRTESEIMVFVQRNSVRQLLTEFIFECIDESKKKSEYQFLEWLNSLRKHWQIEQFRVISGLNGKIAIERDPKEVELYKLQKDQILTYLHHNYKLLDMMTQDVLRGYVTPLSDTVSTSAVVGPLQEAASASSSSPSITLKDVFIDVAKKISVIDTLLRRQHQGTPLIVRAEKGFILNITGDYKFLAALKETCRELGYLNTDKPKILCEAFCNEFNLPIPNIPKQFQKSYAKNEDITWYLNLLSFLKYPK